MGIKDTEAGGPDAGELPLRRGGINGAALSASALGIGSMLPGVRGPDGSGAAGLGPSGPGAIAGASGPSSSITDFLTDGSLAALCDEMTRLAGVRVELRDERGRLIVQRTAEVGGSAWAVVPHEPAAPVEGTVIPIALEGRTIGSIVIGAGEPRMGPASRSRLESALTAVAKTTAELCQHEVELRHRIKEVGALTKMASMLVRAAGPERVLELALESSLDVLGLDAGSIVLLKEDADGVSSENEEDLILKCSRNLSADWLNSPLPLSKDRVFDRLAMASQVVVSEDMASDDRVLIRERARAEGLCAAIHAGLVFQNRPLGVIRLYSRTPRGFEESEKRLLASLASQAAAALEQSRLLKFEQEEQRVQRQLQLAADVQRRMLPKGVPSIPQLDMAARYIPSFELGGDFYDLLNLSGHLGLVVGDVVGKGIPAALLMSSVRASLRAHVQRTYDIDEVVSRVNVALCQDTRDNEFASLWYGVLDPFQMRLTYCSAGHEPPMVVRVPEHRAPTEADIDELSVGGMVVGIDRSQRYQRAIYDMNKGDVLLAYTDGLVDTTNFAGARFGKKRLRQAFLDELRDDPAVNANRLVDRMLWHVRQFAGLSPRPDDLTIVVVRLV